MTIYICLDDRNGLLFNKRRQSRDAVVLEDIRNTLSGELLIEPYSEKLVEAANIPYQLLSEASTQTDFFAENCPSQEMVEKAKRIVIYRWNRHYPADTWWNPDLAQLGFTLSETTEFPGKSHEKITREVYTR